MRRVSSSGETAVTATSWSYPQARSLGELLVGPLGRAFPGGTPHGFCGFMPALLAKVARFRDVPTAHSTFARYAVRLHGHEDAAHGGKQGQERGTEPQPGGPRRRFARRRCR